VVLKLLPEIVMTAVIAALEGVKPEIAGVGNTVKLVAVVRVTPLTKTDIGPVSALAGTSTDKVVAVEDTTFAPTPLKETTFSDGVVLKFVPVIVTIAPTEPF
jgi:hypothetical protein